MNNILGGGPVALAPSETTAPTKPVKPPSGATMKVPNRDGKMYWFNDKHENLGPVE